MGEGPVRVKSQGMQVILVWSLILLTALMGLVSEPVGEISARLASTARWDDLDSDDAEDAQGAEDRPTQTQSASRTNRASRRRSVPRPLTARQDRTLPSAHFTSDRDFAFRQNLPDSPHFPVSL